MNLPFLAYKAQSFSESAKKERIWEDWENVKPFLIFLLISIAVALLVFATYKLTRYFGRTHTVTLSVDGREEHLSIKHGQCYHAPIPQTDKIFKGWYRDTAFTIPFNSSDRILRDTIIYAKFE